MSLVTQQVEKLHTNLYGPKKEDIILDIVTKSNFQERLSISLYYRSIYGKSLFDDIKSKIGGDFGYCAAQMFLSPLEFCVYHLKLGLKKSNECPFEMLTSKSVNELKIIENAYKNYTGKELKDDILKSFSGAVGRNLLNLFVYPRIVNPSPKSNECEKYANKLIEIEPKYWTEDEELFKEIFIQRSREELVLIARYYLKNTGYNLVDVIDKKTKGKHQILLKEILYNNVMPHELFAEKIYLAIKGAGTNEEVLSRALVSRFEIDMPLIREMYQYKYNSSMREDIIGDTSGFYQKLCVYLCEK